MQVKIDQAGGGDKSWLDTTHGVYNAQTATLDIASFTAGTHYPDGYVPAGTPVNAADRKAVKPWTAAEGEVLGFLYDDRAVDGQTKVTGPVLLHGGIRVKRLPVEFTVPTPAPANFTFNTGGDA